MTVYFADTAYYVAFLYPRDSNHGEAIALTASMDAKIITTNFVLTELAAYFAKPPHREGFCAFVKQLRRDKDVTILPVDEELFESGLALYEQRADKAWSLTDCISFVVMKEWEITQALTTDRHFKEAGFQILLPEARV